MKFRCSNCGRDYDSKYDSHYLSPRGNWLYAPWFKDENRVDNYASVCLACGTVHAVHGSALKALFTMGSRALVVAFYIPIDRVRRMIAEEPNSLPMIVLEALKNRGLIGASEDSAVAKGDFGSKVSSGPSTEENEDTLKKALVAATITFAMYATLSHDGEIGTATLVGFFNKADEYRRLQPSTTTGFMRTHVQAADILKSALDGGVSWELIMDLARSVQADAAS